MRAGSRRSRSGFTLVWVLAATAVLSIGLAAFGQAWSVRAQRERESDLLRIGTLYADALARYRAASPGSDASFPADLAQLVEDRRFAGTVRHLRRLYPDPMDPARPWGLLKDDRGRIVGVYSQDSRRPLRRHGGPSPGVADAASYRDWHFVGGGHP